MSLGYAEAGCELVNGLQNGSAKDLVVLPMLFCFRHSMELLIKAIETFYKPSFQDGHDILARWPDCAGALKVHFDKTDS